MFGEVPCDSALQIRQPAVHPADEALTLMLRTQWKDQNPYTFPFLWRPRANSSRHKAPVVLTHTLPHVHTCGHESLPAIHNVIAEHVVDDLCDFGASLYFCHCIYITYRV